MQFEFATATRIIFGAGAAKQAGRAAKGFGRRVLVVTGRNPNRVEPVLARLREEGLELVNFEVSGEPEVSTIEQGVDVAREGSCELVVAVGGGSVIDAGKAIAAMVGNRYPLLDFLEVVGAGKALTDPSLPLIAIPTTAGTGSEVTRNAVLFSPEHAVKVSLRSPCLLPKVALVDPELTFGLPPALTASTGMDALTQVIEPYVCARPNPITDSVCADGIRRAAQALPVAFRQGQDIAARQAMSLVSLYGGLALANAGLGAVHGFAGPIGGMFPAPHGAICAALLPHVTAINLRSIRQRQPGAETLRRYDFVAQTLTGRPAAAADDGVAWLRSLVAELRIAGLGTYGIKRSHFDELAGKAAQASSMKANPIVLTGEELLEILELSL
ncbi:MAG TPA: iron-containing alcohol dehydrogenase [Methylomirabilota bacterium]|nr:iron-containing alcohol dehydrogenase [Methylomirabilota bacterium]